VNSAERRFIQKNIKRARAQRNATTNNEDFDYWNNLYEHYLSLLKTEV
jgi:hypothetical protein